MRRYPVHFICVAAAILGSILTAAQPFAETDDRQGRIARAMEAAPESISKNATIVEADGTVLRAGSNDWHCFPNVGPGSDHPMCNDAVWMRFMDALGQKGDFRTDRIGISYMLAGDDKVNIADPFDKEQEPGETWVQEGPHLMILVPDPKMLEGISDDPEHGGPYVMWGGTPYVHLMVPVEPPME